MIRSRTRRGKPWVAIIGPGRLGQAIGKLLIRAGSPVRWVAARRPSAARSAVKFIGSGRPVPLLAPELAKASVILLTVSDAAVAALALSLSARLTEWKGKVVLHTCGSLPASVLAPLQRRGAAIGSLHPFQTIPNPLTGARNLVGCYWAVEGDPAARKVALRWVRALDGVTFSVRPSGRALYHLSAFLVCPALVTLMDRSVRLLRRAGVPEKTARPMLARFVAETARNFAELGSRRALTGPAPRGDWTTIHRHVRVLRRTAADVVPLYRALLRAMLRLAGKRLPSKLKEELTGGN